VTSHAKTFLTVSVRAAERTASELACEPAPSEGRNITSGGDGKKNRGERSEPLRAKEKKSELGTPLVTIPLSALPAHP